MALDRSVLVPRPEHGTVLRTVSGKTYVYYATAVYRNEKGQPTCERSSIGRLDEETGMLIPNRNYYEIYLKQSQPMNGSVMAHGVYHMFTAVAEKLGLTAILKKYFPDIYKEILTAAQYMLSEGNVMSYVEDYTESHDTAMGGILSDVQCSKLFASIRQEDILLFMRDWMNQRKTDEYVAYDVTSISSYAKQIEELEWGYNRDKEKLPQINLGLYYGEESGLPLYYRVYPGSISDKAHLQYMVADNPLIRGKKMRYVMDRGFYSAENLQYLVQQGHRFVIALPGSLSYGKELIRRHRNEIVNVEKSFDNLKNDLDCKRLHVHNTETMTGKLFAAFLALIVKSYMQQHKPDQTMTQKKMLLELDKIKTLDLHAKAKPRLLNPITKSARTILQALDIPLPV